MTVLEATNPADLAAAIAARKAARPKVPFTTPELGHIVQVFSQLGAAGTDAFHAAMNPGASK